MSASGLKSENETLKFYYKPLRGVYGAVSAALLEVVRVVAVPDAHTHTAPLSHSAGHVYVQRLYAVYVLHLFVKHNVVSNSCSLHSRRIRALKNTYLDQS